MFKQKMTFGRAAKCNFTFLGEEHGIASIIGNVSSTHFTIHNSVEGVYLEDHSTHGTFVNGTRVTVAPNGKKQVLLQSRDKISVVMDNGPGKKDSLFVVK
jgi:predicted component of type VI protein secretion system